MNLIDRPTTIIVLGGHIFDGVPLAQLVVPKLGMPLQDFVSSIWVKPGYRLLLRYVE